MATPLPPSSLTPHLLQRGQQQRCRGGSGGRGRSGGSCGSGGSGGGTRPPSEGYWPKQEPPEGGDGTNDGAHYPHPYHRHVQGGATGAQLPAAGAQMEGGGDDKGEGGGTCFFGGGGGKG